MTPQGVSLFISATHETHQDSLYYNPHTIVRSMPCRGGGSETRIRHIALGLTKMCGSPPPEGMILGVPNVGRGNLAAGLVARGTYFG